MQRDDWNIDSSNYRCLECGTLFTTEIAIESHIQKLHSPNTTYQCPHCGKVYKDNWHLNRHILSHGLQGGADPKVVCTRCKKTFKDSAQLNKHQGEGCEVVEDVSAPTPGQKSKGDDDLVTLSPSPPSLKTQKSTEHLIVSEWNEENLPRPLTQLPRLQRNTPVPARYSSSPIIGIEYYCKICGDVLPRLKFCGHIANHFPDIYLPRTEDPPRQISNDFIQQTGVPLGRQNSGCRTCTVSNSLMQKMRQTLEGMADGFARIYRRGLKGLQELGENGNQVRAMVARTMHSFEFALADVNFIL